ncbi:MAG: hypothetical protein MUC48_12420 [Leptolyngbya sp. Prado105]|jgi:hypothetical protein|nr:hypothetical protein [Leptolyngbya sp. Prado105]
MTQRRSSALIVFAGLLSILTLGCSTATTSSVPQAPAPSVTPEAQPEPKPAEPKPEKTEPTKIEPASAVAPKPSPVASTKPQSEVPTPDISQDKIISSVKADWNGDGVSDRAILVVGEPTEADLLIYLSGISKPMTKKNIAWRGEMYGTNPSLSVNPQGSLVITSANEAIGRDRWSKKVTALYDKGEFEVAGFTYSYRDTLDLANTGTCDVNLLTGKGIKNDKEFRTTLKPMSLAEWTEDSEPKECR